MTRRSRAKSSSLFLLELILAILIFSIASAVCVQFFVKSHLLSRDSRVLELSVNEAASVAEIIYLSSSMEDCVDSILALDTQPDYSRFIIDSENVQGEQTNMALYYDENFVGCAKENASYIMYVDLNVEKQLLTAYLSITPAESSQAIYSLNLSHHLQRRAYDE